jgi:hypothetical protein
VSLVLQFVFYYFFSSMILFDGAHGIISTRSVRSRECIPDITRGDGSKLYAVSSILSCTTLNHVQIIPDVGGAIVQQYVDGVRDWEEMHQAKMAE